MSFSKEIITICSSRLYFVQLSKNLIFMCFKQIITLFLIKKNRIYPLAKISPNEDCICGISHLHYFFSRPRSKFLQNGVFSPNMATLVLALSADRVAKAFIYIINGSETAERDVLRLAQTAKSGQPNK